jgi:methylmalonyl-CoA mutase N-terminal domain/subunit
VILCKSEYPKEYFYRIAELGGVMRCIDNNFLVHEIAEASYHYQREVDSKKRKIIGVNEFLPSAEEKLDIPVLSVDRNGQRRQIERLNEVRRSRFSAEVRRTLQELRSVAKSGQNTMPATVDAVRAYETMSEMIDVLRDVYSIHQAQSV